MTGYREVLRQLENAQKGAARSAPAYSRFVNRRLGRLLAGAAYLRGLTPNQVTAVSAVHTFAGIVLVATLPPSWWLGLVVALLLIAGYAWDSADGQLARLTGTGSAAGEWLDHVVDAVKVVSLPCAVLVGLHRFTAIPDAALIIPIGNVIVSSVLFFGMILTEQLRRAAGTVSRAATSGRAPWLRSVLVLPTDYGLLCLVFLIYGAPSAFLTVYGVITVATCGFLVLALPKWFMELHSPQERGPEQGTAQGRETYARAAGDDAAERGGV